MTTELVGSEDTTTKGTTMSEKYDVGMSVKYISEKGFPKLALISHTHDSVDPDSLIPRPEPGFYHLVVWNLTTQHFIQYADIPCREIAESIPDYRIEGQLVGFFEEAK